MNKKLLCAALLFLTVGAPLQAIIKRVSATLTNVAPFQCPKGDDKCEKGLQEIIAKYHAFQTHVEENKDTLEPQRSATHESMDHEKNGQPITTTTKVFIKNEDVFVNKLPAASNQRAFFNAWVNYINAAAFVKNSQKIATPKIPGIDCFLQTTPGSDKITVTYIAETESYL